MSTRIDETKDALATSPELPNRTHDILEVQRGAGWPGNAAGSSDLLPAPRASRIQALLLVMSAWGWAPLVATIGCASTGTRVSDMSAGKHEEAAHEQTQLAQEHQAQVDPDLWIMGTEGCATFCFDTWSNPSSEHARRAREHRATAAKHRRASATLRTTESRLCAGLSDRDRDVSPFFHIADIASVNTESEPFEVRFKPVRGLDVDAMQRLIDCHIGRNAVLGFEAPEMDFCPLVPRGVRAKVRAEGSALVIELKAKGPKGRNEIHARLLRLEARLDNHSTERSPN